MSVDPKCVAYRKGEESVRTGGKMQVFEPTMEITPLPDSPSDDTDSKSPSPPTLPESPRPENTDCGLVRRLIHILNRKLSGVPSSVEEEVVKKEPKMRTGLKRFIGYVFGGVGLMIQAVMHRHPYVPELTVIYVSAIICTAVTHCERGCFSKVPQYAPRKREAYKEIDDTADSFAAGPSDSFAAGPSTMSSNRLTVQEMLDMGFSVGDIFDQGATVQEIAEAGATVRQMISAGISADIMIGAGLSADVIFAVVAAEAEEREKEKAAKAAAKSGGSAHMEPVPSTSKFNYPY